MTIAKEEFLLSGQHQKIWNTIRSLKDGERILGSDLRELAGIADIREFYKIIEDLREAGIFIGASKYTPRGYYEIKTESEMENFLRSKRSELARGWSSLDRLEKKWNRKNNK